MESFCFSTTRTLNSFENQNYKKLALEHGKLENFEIPTSLRPMFELSSKENPSLKFTETLKCSKQANPTNVQRNVLK